MKKPSLPVSIWIILHAGLAAALILSVVSGLPPPSVDTNLLSLLPSSGRQGMAEADRLLSQRNSRNFVILTGSSDFFRAKERAEELYRGLEEHSAEPAGQNGLQKNPSRSEPLFETLSFFIEENAMEDFSAYLHEYRYVLMDPQTAALLEGGEAETIANEALAWAYGAFNFAGLEHLDTDPFLLTERGLRHFLESSLLTSGLSLRDGVLTAEFEGRHYVLLRGRLSEAGASISRGSGVREIYRIAGELTQGAHDGKAELEEAENVRFVFSGIPFHSYASSSRAQREITLIGAVTMLLLLLLFLRVFRSPLPALLIIAAAAVSIFTGLCAVFLVFRTIHILTFNLGASLIGLSVDYSIHFFIRRRNGLAGTAIRHSLARGVSLSFISSFVCFLIFLFAPFGILRQFALFSAMGLLSSYITVLCLLPELTVLINKKNPIKAKAQAEKTGFGILHGKVLAPNGKRALLAGLCIIFLGAIFFGHGGAARQSTLKIKNDLRSLYTVPPELLESERIASSVMNYNSENWFLVSGSTLQELLEHEEILLARLNEEGSFLGISRFIPPEKTQAARYQAAAALLPLAEAQYEALGFPPESAGLFLKDYEALAGHYVLPSSVPPMASEILSSLLIRVGGQNSGERWYSAIMPLAQAGTKAGASGAAENPASLADQYEWAAVLNRVEDISVELDSLTGAMIKLLGAAFGLIVLGLIFYYRNVLQILKIAAIPVFAALASLAVHALSGLFLSFFSVSGFVLVLGLGLDYMFYLTENSAPAENPQSSTVKLAVILSYATTAISFGALVFSSFMPARLLALSIFPGLGAAFMWAMLVKD